LETAIKYNNEVAQGLSSSLFTTNQQNVFKWIGFDFIPFLRIFFTPLINCPGLADRIVVSLMSTSQPTVPRLVVALVATRKRVVVVNLVLILGSSTCAGPLGMLLFLYILLSLFLILHLL